MPQRKAVLKNKDIICIYSCYDFFCKKRMLCNLKRHLCQKEDVRAKEVVFQVEYNRIIRVYVLKPLILEEWDGQHNEYNEAVLSWEATPIIRNLSVI